MDDVVIEASFRAHTEGQTHFTRRMAIAMALMFNDTPKRIVRRLEQMGLVKDGSWNWFLANGGITPEQIAEVRADLRRTGKSTF